MVWSHNDLWMVTGDHAGFVKYWQSNMNNVKMFQAHKEAIRGIRWASHAVVISTIFHMGGLYVNFLLHCYFLQIKLLHYIHVPNKMLKSYFIELKVNKISNKCNKIFQKISINVSQMILICCNIFCIVLLEGNKILLRNTKSRF